MDHLRHVPEYNKQVITWAERMVCCKYHSPHGYPLEPSQMVFADAVGHGFEHHDARETMLDPYGDVLVRGTAP